VWNAGPVSHPWQDQVRILELARDMPFIVKRLDDKWNSTEGCNPSPEPVIKAWHGVGNVSRRYHEMKVALELAEQIQKNKSGELG
jgi:hypothetical protein